MSLVIKVPKRPSGVNSGEVIGATAGGVRQKVAAAVSRAFTFAITVVTESCCFLFAYAAEASLLHSKLFIGWLL